MRDNNGQAITMMSASSGNTSIVQLALAAGCNSNAQNRTSDYSMANNHLEVIGFLARRKGSIMTHLFLLARNSVTSTWLFAIE